MCQRVCLKASVLNVFPYFADCTVCDHVFVLKPMFVMCSRAYRKANVCDVFMHIAVCNVCDQVFVSKLAWLTLFVFVYCMQSHEPTATCLFVVS